MAEETLGFVSFSIEDERQRDFLNSRSLNTNSQFENVDMSVMEAFRCRSKKRVRPRFRTSGAVSDLVSYTSVASSGKKWEFTYGCKERRRILGAWAHKDDRATKASLLSSRPGAPSNWSPTARRRGICESR